MKHEYILDYHIYQGEALFEIDDSLFTEERALEIVRFFSWDVPVWETATEVVMRRYALLVIFMETLKYYNVEQTKNGPFYDLLSLCPLDGRSGITLKNAKPYIFKEEYINQSHKKTS